ncbi:MAG TPA: L-ribulose-5-phosphate 4-epimerase [Polyangia bacterium]|jgi:L-ribulose-5-phosphate 4-epimerase
MVSALKEAVWKANLDLVKEGLVIQTFGNVSAVDRGEGVVVIKPSGVRYDDLTPEQMSVVSLEDGKVLEGKLRPSSDLATHLVLYRAFADVGGIVHTHSLFATAWAQAKRPIPALGTTHADYWHGEIPCTRPMTSAEIESAYEANTGEVIVETFQNLEPLHRPAVLVASHGPFAWGRDAADAVHNAAILEYLARLASETLRIAPETGAMQAALLDKHFLRKHGPKAYYGQK